MHYETTVDLVIRIQILWNDHFYKSDFYC